MPDINILHIDHTYIKITSDDPGKLMQLSETLTFSIPNAKFHPKVRARIWDGKIRLFNLKTRSVYKGLLKDILRFSADNNYSVGIDEALSKDILPETSIEDTTKYFNSLNPQYKGEHLKPYDHQIVALNHAMNNKRALMLSPTASGKSLVIYGLMRWLQKENCKKIMLVVPSVSLVYQMENDLSEYSKNDSSWNAEENIHKIFEGQCKTTDKPIVITTWQSVYNQPKEFFEEYDAVIVDEAHQLKAESIKGILEKCSNSAFRYGLTGTLDGTKTNKMIIEGLTGPVFKVTSTRELMDKKLISDFSIRCIVLDYSKESRKFCKDFKYHEELEYLVGHKKRNSFIAGLAMCLKGNTLILYQYVEKHGEILFELISKKCEGTNRKVFFISGDVEAEVREEIRNIVETENDAIIVASFGTFSTGISLRRLHGIIFASPSKSRVRVLQSIGRQLRLAKNKGSAVLYDISDNLKHKSKANYTLNHFLERLKIYDQEKFDYTINNIDLEPGEK